MKRRTRPRRRRHSYREQEIPDIDVDIFDIVTLHNSKLKFRVVGIGEWGQCKLIPITGKSKNSRTVSRNFITGKDVFMSAASRACHPLLENTAKVEIEFTKPLSEERILAIRQVVNGFGRVTRLDKYGNKQKETKEQKERGE